MWKSSWTAARPGKLIDDLPFVQIERGSSYTIRIINNSNHDAAVWVGIDGLSIFAFNEEADAAGERRDYKVVVPAQGSREVKGWYFNQENTRGFMVTDYPESAATLKSSTANIGMITAQFRACWEKNAAPPEDELVLRGNATGFGSTFAERWNQVDRAFGEHRATVTVRYSKN